MRDPPPIENDDADEDEKANENENETAEALSREESEYKKLKFKPLKDLSTAVKNYGPNASFTVSMFEALSGGGYLTPAEWFRVTQAVLTCGQFLSLKADFLDRCQSLAGQNQRDPKTPAAAWTLDKLSG